MNCFSLWKREGPNWVLPRWLCEGKKQICKLRVVGKKKRSEMRGLETRRSTNKWDGGVLAKKDNCGRVITSFPLSAADCERWRVMRTACVRPGLLELLPRPVRWAWPQRASLHCCLHTGRRHKQNLGCFPLHLIFKSMLSWKLLSPSQCSWTV